MTPTVSARERLAIMLSTMFEVRLSRQRNYPYDSTPEERGKLLAKHWLDDSDYFLSQLPSIRYLLEPVEGVEMAQEVIARLRNTATHLLVPIEQRELALAHQVLALAAENAAMKEKIGGGS